MNQRFDDINSQSTIVSFRMPELKMHFVCTGDAHDETFYHPIFSPHLIEGVHSLKKNFTNVLILPHHGASSNISRKMLEIFMPDLLVISAGNGKQHGHPNKQTLLTYVKVLEENLTESSFSKNFLKVGPQGNFSVFFEGKKKTAIGYLRDLGESPIVSTNVHGTIQFRENGLYSTFSEIVEDSAKVAYVVDFSKRIDHNLEKEKIEEHGNNIVSISDSFYYRVSIEEVVGESKNKTIGKEAFYKAKKCLTVH